ncbi:MAG: elongation factor G, partial [Flavobacteriales bacterium]|nr:elongation factor G [Flavobacteriales bacterium]
TAEVERSLRVLDGAVALFCAVSGVQPQSETVWRQASRYGVPRICFINKMDREGADFLKVVAQIRKQFQCEPAIMQIPIGEGAFFKGVVDLRSMKALYWNQSRQGKTWSCEDIPPDMLLVCQEKRQQLIELVAGLDEVLLDQYLNNPEVSTESLNAAIRRLTLSGTLHPVFCGTAHKNIGVQALVDGIIEFLPSTADNTEITAMDLNHDIVQIDASSEAPLSALVFKVTTDPHVGKIAMLRVYSGDLRSGDQIQNMRSMNKFKVGRLLRMRSDKMEVLESISAGDICALVGVKDLKTSDTLCALGQEIVLESMDFPDPVIGYAIEAATSADEKIMGKVLSNIQDEDPTIQVTVDSATGQTVLKGMGELHLEIILEKMRSEYKLNVNVGAPKVAFKETITGHADHKTVLKKQTGGSGSYAIIQFEISGGDADTSGLQFVNDVKGGAIPKEFINSVEKGFTKAMMNGPLAGYPVQSLKVRLYDGDTHDEDSSAIDFEKVAHQAFKEIAPLCKPRLLEPIMKVLVDCPEDAVGAITADINRKRGLVSLIEDEQGMKLIHAEIPLKSLFKYIGTLRTIASGRANVNISFSHYSQVSDGLVEELLA